jgi:hypothetical protein
MNLQPSSPVPSQPAVPPQGLSHAPTQAELLELGMLAIEDANRAEAAASAVAPAAPLPPQPLSQPAPAPAPVATPTPPVSNGASSDVLAAAPSSVVAPTTANTPLAPSTSDVLAAVKQAPQAVPAVAPGTTPAKARDVAAPVPPTAPVDPAPATETVTAPPPAAPNTLSSLSRMDLSANSMQMKGVARLRALNMLLYAVLVILIGGIIVGGWYLYEYLKTNSGA